MSNQRLAATALKLFSVGTLLQHVYSALALLSFIFRQSAVTSVLPFISWLETLLIFCLKVLLPKMQFFHICYCQLQPLHDLIDVLTCICIQPLHDLLDVLTCVLFQSLNDLMDVLTCTSIWFQPLNDLWMKGLRLWPHGYTPVSGSRLSMTSWM